MMDFIHALKRSMFIGDGLKRNECKQIPLTAPTPLPYKVAQRRSDGSKRPPRAGENAGRKKRREKRELNLYESLACTKPKQITFMEISLT